VEGAHGVLITAILLFQLQSTRHNTWTKVSHKRGRSSPDDIERESKHAKDNQHWLHPPSTSTSNRYSPLVDADGADRLTGPEHPQNPHPSTSRMYYHSEQVAPRFYETKALAQNQVKDQPKTSDAYRAIVKALADKRTEFHTYKPKEERNCRVVLKHMHSPSIPPTLKQKLRTSALGHMVTNIWNIKQYRT
jgi:hypothetical protein